MKWIILTVSIAGAAVAQPRAADPIVAWHQCTERAAVAFVTSGEPARDIALAAVESCPREMREWYVASARNLHPMDLEQEKEIKVSQERTLVRVVVEERTKLHTRP